MSLTELTPKQSRFVDEYLKDTNATQAAIRAGYSEKTAYSQGQRLLKNVEVDKSIQAGLKAQQERTQIDADFVIQGIAKNIARCEQAVAVTDRNGDPVYCETEDGRLVPAYRYDSGGALKGYELLGKHLKLFTDKHEHSGPNGGPIQLSDTERAARLSAILEAVKSRSADGTESE